MTQVQTTEKTHSKFSPSKAKQFLTCPLSFFIQDHPSLPPETPNYAAIRGTDMHEIMAAHLTKLNDMIEVYPDDWHKYLEKLIEDEREPDIKKALMHLKELFIGIDKPISKLHIEEYLDILPEYNISGTCDLWFTDTEEHDIFVVDFKFGNNKVEAINNNQLLLYTYPVYKIPEHFINFVHSCIIQPAFGLDWHVMSSSSYTIEIEKLINNIKELHSYNINTAPASPGDPCKWCRGKGICPHYKSHADQLASDLFKGYEELNSFEGVSDEHLFEIYSKAEEFEQYINQVKKYVYNKLKSGPACGYKLVRSRGIRAWKPDMLTEELITYLDQYPDVDPFKMELKTAPALLSEYPILKKDANIQNLIEKAPGKTISIVPDSDPRDAFIENPFNGLGD